MLFKAGKVQSAKCKSLVRIHCEICLAVRQFEVSVYCAGTEKTLRYSMLEGVVVKQIIRIIDCA